MKIFMTEKGPVDHAYMDGYNFGDRLLEGVIFKVTIKDDKFNVEVDPSSRPYFSQLNQELWLKRAVEYAETEDIFMETPTGGEDAWIEEVKKDDVHSKNNQTD